MEFHILSFEGPDPYARAGGISSRITGLSHALADAGLQTHLWFVGDPELPGHEARGQLHLRRWCQWISRHHPLGVYDGEDGKRSDYSTSLPPCLFATLAPKLEAGERAVVLAEEWHTVDAVLHLDWLLRQAGLRDRVQLYWTANNIFGFDRIDWGRLAEAATIATVSRYMKHRMHRLGVDPVVVPNGLDASAFVPVDDEAVNALSRHLTQRTLLAKIARWDPDKRWLTAVDVTAALRQRGHRPLLVARGGVEAHGAEVLSRAREHGLAVVHRRCDSGATGLLRALADVDEADMVVVESHLDPEAKALLYHGANAVLVNSGHEPFGLVGLETMAVGGVACTGCSGEDYAIAGRNALVMQTGDPMECVGMLARLQGRPEEEQELRDEGRHTAQRNTWPEIVRRNLIPTVELAWARDPHAPCVHLTPSERYCQCAPGRRHPVQRASLPA